MSSSVLETARLLHQDIEVHKQKAVDELLEEHKLIRDTIVQEHKAKRHIDKIYEATQKLVELYDDKTGLRKKELEDIGGDNQFPAFYDRLLSIRDFYRKFPNANERKSEVDVDVKAKVSFTSEENNGKFLDLNQFYIRYINLPQFSTGQNVKIDYLTFLAKFEKLDEVSRSKKLGAKTKEYKKYLDDVLAYLQDFYTRFQPLVNVSNLVNIMEADFEEHWKAQDLKGWFGPEVVETKEPKREDDKEEEKKSDKKQATSADNSLYCQACQKSFAKKTVFDAHLKGKAHIKNVAKTESQSKQADSASKSMALVEHKILAFIDLLRDQLTETQKYIEKKQTSLPDEIKRDMLAEEETPEGSDSDDDKDKPLYNPLNLPLDYNGKPIPYWLYKLHGLNIEYRCELCGGYSYWGPRAFERHFKEWRHSYGLKCLGIANSKEFMNVTKIEDAKKIWAKLQKDQSQTEFRPDDEEEFEDHEGNVYHKKTFEDLKKQGII